ncbi:hypothetical protein BD779DRAFT_1473818 [Infundibulicybe gibba]|nr:hypothetical protein BD779DRAFT_1473818 [Infundibulicybe gibba]
MWNLEKKIVAYPLRGPHKYTINSPHSIRTTPTIPGGPCIPSSEPPPTLGEPTLVLTSITLRSWATEITPVICFWPRYQHIKPHFAMISPKGCGYSSQTTIPAKPPKPQLCKPLLLPALATCNQLPGTVIRNNTRVIPDRTLSRKHPQFQERMAPWRCLAQLGPEPVGVTTHSDSSILPLIQMLNPPSQSHIPLGLIYLDGPSNYGRSDSLDTSQQPTLVYHRHSNPASESLAWNCRGV